jgi:hypothetical protein
MHDLIPRQVLRATKGARPADALVEVYARRGDYVDGFHVDVAGEVTLAEFIDAFFASRAFRSERWLIAILGNPTSDAALGALASGASDRFAAWKTEARREDEILLSDFTAFTRCWLKVAPAPGRLVSASRLFFGTAFTRGSRPGVGNLLLRLLFAALRPLHAFYARTLLNSAAARLFRERRAGRAGRQD